jgi:hypothetical protein
MKKMGHACRCWGLVLALANLSCGGEEQPVRTSSQASGINACNHIDATYVFPTDQPVFSCSGQYWARMQSDGNFVIYAAGWRPVWALSWVGVTPVPGSVAVFQTDGHLVVYGPQGALWGSGSYGFAAGTTSLVMQDDGNLVIYSVTGAPVWSSTTGLLVQGYYGYDNQYYCANPYWGGTAHGIQNCINAARYGGVIYIPAGSYSLDASIWLNAARRIQGLGGVTFNLVNSGAGIEMTDRPNRSRLDSIALSWPNAIDIFNFVIPYVPSGGAYGFDAGHAVYRLDNVNGAGRYYGMLLKANNPSNAFTAWFVDGAGLYLREEINAPNAPSQLALKTTPQKYASRLTWVGPVSRVHSDDYEYLGRNTPPNPCAQVYPARGSVHSDWGWNQVSFAGLYDFGANDLGQQETLIVSGYPGPAGEYQFFARGRGNIGWGVKDDYGNWTTGPLIWGANQAPGFPPDTRYLCSFGIW